MFDILNLFLSFYEANRLAADHSKKKGRDNSPAPSFFHPFACQLPAQNLMDEPVAEQLKNGFEKLLFCIPRFWWKCARL
jgi:hypothetical protein